MSTQAKLLFVFVLIIVAIPLKRYAGVDYFISFVVLMLLYLSLAWWSKRRNKG